MTAPTVGRIVHYVSRGSADGQYASECRAAIVTALDPAPEDNPHQVFVSLAVLNPTGLFFHQLCLQSEDEKTGGTWHWPERT